MSDMHLFNHVSNTLNIKPKQQIPIFVTETKAANEINQTTQKIAVSDGNHMIGNEANRYPLPESKNESEDIDIDDTNSNNNHSHRQSASHILNYIVYSEMFKYYGYK